LIELQVQPAVLPDSKNKPNYSILLSAGQKITIYGGNWWKKMEIGLKAGCIKELSDIILPGFSGNGTINYYSLQIFGGMGNYYL